MALTTDSTTDFPAGGSGYTFNGTYITFSGGTAALNAGVTGTWYTIQTPDINTTAWGSIYDVQATITEAVGYQHKFLVSFDSGTTWKAARSSGWVQVAAADIDDSGMVAAELANIRKWPDANALMFLVGLYRSVGGGNGTIDLISVRHGTQTVAFALEDTVGSGYDTLDFEPEFPMEPRIDRIVDVVETDSGHIITWHRSTKFRTFLQLAWRVAGTSDRDTLRTFLLAHVETPFQWTKLGDSAAKLWKVVSMTETEQPGLGLYEIRAEIRQVIPEAFSPLDVANLKLWLDAAVGVTTGVGSTVSAWADQSGNGYTMAQATDLEKPVWVDAVVNGLPVVRFDDSDDGMTPGASASISGDDCTVFLVYAWKGNSTGDLGVLVGSNAGWALGPRGGNASYANGGGWETGGAMTADTFYIHECRQKANEQKSYLNGTQQTSRTAANPAQPERLDLAKEGAIGFGTIPADADVAEIVIYEAYLTDAQQLSVRTYLANKYGISI